MLFHAPEFILAFIPVTLLGFFLLGRLDDKRWAIGWLVALSFVYYGWWRIQDLWLLGASLGFNYVLGRLMSRRPSRLLLAAGVAANLLLLGYFKYLVFVVGVFGAATGVDWAIGRIILPLGISFFTFQQIAYLVDANDGLAHEDSFLNYCLFVVFFPQLVAGPIVHHKEMLPQFGEAGTFRPRASNFAVGLTVFGIGLFKKVVLADGVAGFVNDAFAAAAGTPLTVLEAWGAAVAFSFQIYFDFSGYSDMAVGLARLFGIRLPVNFASPYKTAGIIEFWSRWHITLTRFLTAYVYNPVSMALTRRRMQARKPVLTRAAPKPGAFLVLLAFPTMLTMTLAGIWHGAGWQFVLFGVLHGAYLVVNHAWRAVRRVRGIGPDRGRPWRPLGVVLTFAAVTVGMVVFRSESVPHAMAVLGGMAGLNGFVLPEVAGSIAGKAGVDLRAWVPVAHTEYFGGRQMAWLVALSLIVWGLPNTQEWVGRFGYGIDTGDLRVSRTRLLAVLPRPFRGWRPTLPQGAMLGVLLCFALLQAFSAAPKAFLYFNF
ncbi:MAG TPA: MBOAT family O-acyltransferase [Azospirillaceae bacterium]|nr:MBOAT family O-acyltransferase [Azospirillaceae bacterium]